MTINENTIKGKWLEIKGDIRKAWGQLTDDDLEKTKGDLNSIRGLIQQKFGQAEGDYNEKLSNILKRFETKKDETVEEIKKSIK